jgi:hypothetical protein
VEGLHHLRARFSHWSIHFNFTEELFGNSLKGIWRPFREPIDCGTVNNRWEISDSVSQRGSNRGEAKNNMEEFFASLKEITKQLLWRSVRASFFIFSWCSHKLTDISFLIGWENVRDFTGVENIVDILKETLLLDLGISEKECGRVTFATDLSHQFFDVFSPLLSSVDLLDFNLEHIEVRNLGCKSTK